jgi:hypothetical protein
MNEKSTQKTIAPIMLKLKHANIYHNPKQKARGKKIKAFLPPPQGGSARKK